MKYIAGLFICLVLMVPLHAQQQDSEAEQVLLEALGVFSGVGTYMTYAAIGSLVDGHQAGLYSDELTGDLLFEYLSYTMAISIYLDGFAQNEAIDADDRELMGHLNKGYKLMIDQLNAYRNYMDKDDSALLETYKTKRLECWNVINAIYGYTG